MGCDRKRKIRIGEAAEGIFHRLVDSAYRRWPRPIPPLHLLETCRIISHRGEHDNCSRFENTLPAFDAALDAGAWGIEMDVRWTRDWVPVVFHDPDTRRLFRTDARIGHMVLETLKKRFPIIPTLSEVVDRYGGRIHLMMEIKSEPYAAPSIQSRRIRNILAHLTPEQDFHLMALDAGMFGYFGFLPEKALLPIARIRIDRLSRMAALHGWGGLAGHFMPMTHGWIARHHGLGQGIGTGFVDSRRCLFREVARGVDWIFSNRAACLQAICGLKTGV